MKDTVVTIDFWQTILFDPPENMAARNAYRAEILRDALEATCPVSLEQAKAAYLAEAQEFNRRYREEMVTASTRDRLRRTVEIHGAHLTGNAFERVLSAWEDALAAHGATVAPDVRDGLDALRSRYPLVVICDTGYSSGRKLRERMRALDLIDRFSALFFSDEQPRSKPHPSTFRNAVAQAGGRLEASVHIGDTQRTDIAGAQACGMKAILFVGGRQDSLADTTADGIAWRWSEIPAMVERLIGRDA